MQEHVYKLTEVTGTSGESIEEAIRNAVRRTGGSVRNMRWFEVTDLRGSIRDGSVAHWQVTVKIGFTVED